MIVAQAPRTLSAGLAVLSGAYDKVWQMPIYCMNRAGSVEIFPTKGALNLSLYSFCKNGFEKPQNL
ncbi:MAG: hypothetical protein ACK46E_15320, partial [Pseudanabaena sp.]